MPASSGKFREAITRNKGLKLVALVLAGAAWYAIHKTISFEVVIKDVPLKILVDDGWAILDRSVHSVDVLFAGSQGAIRSLDSEHLDVEVDVRGQPRGGSTTVPLLNKQVRGVLGGARAIQVRPPVLTLSLDQEGDAQVPVKVNISAEPPVGYEVEKVVPVPASAKIFGPLQRLKEVDVLRTAPIDLKGRVRSFELRVPVVPPSERWVARIEPDSVLVNVTLAERGTTKEIKDVKVHALVDSELGPSLRIWPNKVEVVLSGRSDLIEGVQRDDLRAYVDCTQLGVTAKYALPVRIDTPPGVLVDSITPPTLEVEVGEL
jgi:YbbR domain-containing protein